jgi:hypothetical protein
MKRKSSLKRFTTILFISAVFIICFLAACQPTPEEPVVIEKNGNIEQKMLQTADPGRQMPSDGQRWQETLDFQSGVQVNIDAEIDVPEVAAYPVVEVKPHEATQEEARKFIEFFTMGQPVYEYEKIRTKADIEQDIISVQAELEKAKNEVPEINRQNDIDMYTEILKQLEEEYSQAPEKMPDLKPATVEFKKADTGINKDITVQSFLGGDSPAYLAVYIEDNHQSDMVFVRNNKVCYKGNFNATDTLMGLSITRQEAQAKAEELFKELGINDFQLEWAEAKTEIDIKNSAIPSDAEFVSDPDLKKCFAFHYSHIYNGVPEINIQPCYGMESESGARYDRPWTPEQIIIYVDDSGIVEFQWSSPGDIVRTINDNVQLKNFEEIKEIFGKQMFYQRTWANSGTKNNKITIKTIRLNLMRVKMKDENRHYLLPVWDFIGDWTRTEGSNDISTENVSFLTVNAIDGSVINRYQGY